MLYYLLLLKLRGEKMELYQDETQSMDDGMINLREVILVLWKRKMMIISVTLIAAILTGIFSFFGIEPVYQAEINIVINMPEAYHTKFGDYALPIKTNSEYISLVTSNDVLSSTITKMGYDTEITTTEDIRGRIKIDFDNNNETQNVFSIVTEANNPEEARKLAECLYDSYVEFLNIMTIEGAVNYYYNLFSIEATSLKVLLESTQNILEKNEQLLTETSPTINQKEALNEIQNQINAREFIVLENVVNPNYTLIEEDILKNKQSINDIEDKMNVYSTYLGELDTIKLDLKQYHDTANYETIQSSIVKITDTSIYLPSKPIAPSNKTSPSHFNNVCIGAILGGVISVSVVLFRWWWQKGSVNEMEDISQENVKNGSQNKVKKKKAM